MSSPGTSANGGGGDDVKSDVRKQLSAKLVVPGGLKVELTNPVSSSDDKVARKQKAEEDAGGNGTGSDGGTGPNPLKIRKVIMGLDKSDDEESQAAQRAVDMCQQELDELNETASKEILEVKTKYNKLRKPLYEKRAKYLNKIPRFWAAALTTHPQLSLLISEEEDDCFHFLKGLEVEEFANVEEGYRIKFRFDENPFFENTELIKEYRLDPRKELESTSTTIKWKPDMDLTKKVEGKEVKDEKGSKTFFGWFCDNTDSTGDDTGELIKDDLWANPMQYYFGAKESAPKESAPLGSIPEESVPGPAPEAVNDGEDDDADFNIDDLFMPIEDGEGDNNNDNDDNSDNSDNDDNSDNSDNDDMNIETDSDEDDGSTRDSRRG